MNKRKSLKKGIRFEVFKRDSFTCQYCGAKAPDVILEVDHIIPVKEGGTDDIMNLVTSCRDCNRGKSCKMISDDSVVVKRQKAAEDAQERLEMMRMLAEWQEELLVETDIQIDQLETLMCNYYPDRSFNENGRRDLIKLIKRFSYKEVYDAFDIALCKYDNLEYAFSKIGGICWNRRYQDR